MSEENETTRLPDEVHEDTLREQMPDELSPDAGQAEMDFDESDSEDSPNVAPLSDEQLRAIVEVLLLVSDKPLSVAKIAEILDGAGRKKIHEFIAEIQQRLADNDFPFQIREVAGGFVLSTLPEYADWIRKLYAPKMKSAKLPNKVLKEFLNDSNFQLL